MGLTHNNQNGLGGPIKEGSVQIVISQTHKHDFYSSFFYKTRELGNIWIWISSLFAPYVM